MLANVGILIDVKIKKKKWIFLNFITIADNAELTERYDWHFLLL